MDPSSAQQHQQEMGSQTLESMLVCTKAQQEKKPRPQEQALKCPRCDSTNTKFCYYNNYSLSQPRYFCKSCRRYWTKGGTLRNVPVGGGCRKNKRSSSSSSSSSKRSQDQPLITTNPNPLSTLPALTYDTNDLSLAFARLHKQQPTGQLGFDICHDLPMLDSSGINNSATNTPGFLDAFRGGYLEAPNGFSNLCYEIGNGNNWCYVENGDVGVNFSEEVSAMPYLDHQDMSSTGGGVTVTTMKQEQCNNGREGDNRVLWGFPWQQLGGDGGNMGDFDSGRESWNGLGSTGHGLLNSPLM